MKKIFFSIAVLFSALTVSAQTSTRPPQGQMSISPNGKIYGEKVDVKTAHPVGDLTRYMGRRPSVTTTVSGKVFKVDRSGDAFMIKDNAGKIIPVRFRNAGYKFPQNLVGKTVLIDGIISKQYTSTEGTPAGRNKGSADGGGYQIAARGVQLMN